MQHIPGRQIALLQPFCGISFSHPPPSAVVLLYPVPCSRAPAPQRPGSRSHTPPNSQRKEHAQEQQPRRPPQGRRRHPFPLIEQSRILFTGIASCYSFFVSIAHVPQNTNHNREGSAPSPHLLPSKRLRDRRTAPLIPTHTLPSGLVGRPSLQGFPVNTPMSHTMPTPHHFKPCIFTIGMKMID